MTAHASVAAPPPIDRDSDDDGGDEEDDDDDVLDDLDDLDDSDGDDDEDDDSSNEDGQLVDQARPMAPTSAAAPAIVIASTAVSKQRMTSASVQPSAVSSSGAAVGPVLSTTTAGVHLEKPAAIQAANLLQRALTVEPPEAVAAELAAAAPGASAVPSVASAPLAAVRGDAELAEALEAPHALLSENLDAMLEDIEERESGAMVEEGVAVQVAPINQAAPIAESAAVPAVEATQDSSAASMEPAPAPVAASSVAAVTGGDIATAISPPVVLVEEPAAGGATEVPTAAAAATEAAAPAPAPAPRAAPATVSWGATFGLSLFGRGAGSGPFSGGSGLSASPPPLFSSSASGASATPALPSPKGTAGPVHGLTGSSLVSQVAVTPLNTWFGSGGAPSFARNAWARVSASGAPPPPVEQQLATVEALQARLLSRDEPPPESAATLLASLRAALEGERQRAQAFTEALRGSLLAGMTTARPKEEPPGAADAGQSGAGATSGSGSGTSTSKGASSS